MSYGDRIRVTKVIPTLECGGTEKQFLALTDTLDSRRFDVECACLRKTGTLLTHIEERRLPLSHYPIRSFRHGAAVPQQLRFAARLLRSRVHVVHAYSFYGNVFAIPAARLTGVPVVIASIRDRGAYLTPAQLTLQRYVCRLADHIVVNAGAVKDWLIDQGYDASKIAVIPNGVDLKRFSEGASGISQESRFGLPPKAPIVAVISRIHPHKGLEYFVDAAAIVARRCPAARFLVVGEPAAEHADYLRGLQQRARDAGVADRVVFAGRSDDVPSVLRHVTVSVMPSLNEALSNALLESMAAGVPVVATRVGGTTEAVTGGVTGLLVPPADAYALAHSICALLEDRRSADVIGRNARRTVEERFSLDRMARATEALYLDLLTQRLGERMPVGRLAQGA